MLNSTKLLYILPDVAYIVELLPTKKPHSFSVQSFHQINGTFLDDNEFIQEHVEKLIQKIEPEEYHLILPDFLFTNTMVDIKESSDTAIKTYIKDKLFPELDLNPETHYLDSFVLTQHQGKSKVQLAGLEKSLMLPIQKAAAEREITFSAVSPLSWTTKSVISLEPSISVIQMGGMLYLAQHYIGIDQTSSCLIEDTDHIIEAVKTLKGAEPNTQTLYLLSSALIENKLKDALNSVLPIQQLTVHEKEDSQMPPYVKQMIEAGAKTLDIPEYAVPKFNLAKYAGDAMPSSSSSASQPTKAVAENEKEKKVVEEESKEVTPAVAPVVHEIEAAEELDIPEKKDAESTDDSLSAIESINEGHGLEPEDDTLASLPSVASATSSLPKPAAPALASASIASAVTSAPELDLSMKDEVKEPETAKDTKEETTFVDVPSAPNKTEAQLDIPDEPLDLSSDTTESASLSETPTKEKELPVEEPKITPAAATTAPPVSPKAEPAPSVKPARAVIKNKNPNGALLKMVGITVTALLVTVAVGVGVGFGVLKMAEKNSPMNQEVLSSSSPTPTPVVEATPTPVATTSATVSKSSKILIVNATKTTGKAGQFKQKLTTAGYTSVDTGNAKGTYDTGTFLLMEKTDDALMASLSKDLGLTLQAGTDKAVEDAKNAYAVVIVLAE